MHYLRKLPVVFLLAAILISAGYAQDRQSFEKFSFAAMSDSRGAENGGERTEVLSTLCRHSSELKPKPDFMVFAGDMVEGSKDPNILTDQLSRWKKIIDTNLSTKLMPVIGNHEVRSFQSQAAYVK